MYMHLRRLRDTETTTAHVRSEYKNIIVEETFANSKQVSNYLSNDNQPFVTQWRHAPEATVSIDGRFGLRESEAVGGSCSGCEWIWTKTRVERTACDEKWRPWLDLPVWRWIQQQQRCHIVMVTCFRLRNWVQLFASAESDLSRE